MSDRENHLRAILARHPGNESSSQRLRIHTAMQELGSVTTYEASRHLDCYDPRPRVWELRRDGIQIKTHVRMVQTESGVSHRVGVYMLDSSQGGK
jgi:hypothetical protein